MAGNRGTVLLAAVCVLAVLVVACSGGFVSGSAHGGLALRSVQENRGTDASATAHRMAPATLSLRGGTSKRSGWSKRHEPDSDAMSVEEDDEGSSSYSSRYNDNEDSSSEASDAGSKRRHAGKHKVTKKHDSVSEEDSRSDSRHSGDEDSHESASESHSQHPHSHSDSEDSRDDRDESESSSSEPPRRCHRRKGGKAMKDESEHEDHESHSQGQSHDEDRSEESHSHDSEEEHSHSHSEEDGRSHSDDSSTRSDESRLDETEDESRQGEDDMSGDDDRDMLQDGTQMKRLALAGAEARELATMGEGRELSETLQGRTFIIERDNHADSLLSGFEILRRRADDASTAGKSFCDIIVDAGGVQVHAHKAVLASISPELETIMSSAGKTGVVKLHGVDPRGLQGAISYIYNGSVEVSPMDLPSVLKAAEVLAVRPLKDACIEHLLEDLSPINALKMRALGASLPCVELAEAAHNMVMEEFPHVSRSTEFLELGQEHLEEVLASEDLLVSSEVEVLEALLRWVAHDPTARTPSLLRLLSHVRLGLMSIDTLAKRVAAAPLIQQTLANDPAWQSMINSALAYVGSPPDQRARLSGPQTRPRLGSKGRYVFCVGGRKGSSAKAQKRVWMLDKLNYDWFEVEPMIHSRKQLAAAELEGRVYAAGGWDGDQYLRSVERFSPLEDCWERTSLMGTARGSFGLVSVGNALVACGGFDGRTHLSSCEMYNATSNTWSVTASLLVGRSGLKVTEADGVVYAIGGFDGTNVLSSMEKLVDGVWHSCAPMTEARRDMAVCVDGGKIYVTGGFDGHKDLASAERYDPATDTWTVLKPMQNPRSGHGLTSVKGKVHAMGGYDGVRYLAQAESLQGEGWEDSMDASLPVRMAHFALTVV